MRIHTNTVTHRDLLDAAPLDVRVHNRSTHNSRSHDYAFEVSLTGTGARHTRYKNSGNRGASPERAATYDDWGWFLSALYDLDPDMKAGPYTSRANFHERTRYPFVMEYFVGESDPTPDLDLDRDVCGARLDGHVCTWAPDHAPTPHVAGDSRYVQATWKD